MADNISIRKPNFTVANGYFFTFDEEQDALLQKTDDGNTAFSYPCDTLLSNTIVSLEFDGVYFWSMEVENTIDNDLEDGLYIKRWQIDNYITKLRQTIPLVSSSSHIYEASCFTLEHYHTKLTTTVSGGETTIYIDEYSNNSNVINDAVLHLGPNSNGEEEDIQVTDTVFGGVTLETAIQYSYIAEEDINFHRRLWLFNNNNGNSSDTGALYKFDSHTGGYMDKYAGGAYKAVTACTFYKIDSFQELGSKDMLMYAKGTNTLFVNVEAEQKTLYEAETVNDSFTGTDGEIPDDAIWYVETGTPNIQSNKLEMNIVDTGEEAIASVYYLPGDFDVYVDCELTSYNTTYSGINYMDNSLKLLFPNEQDRFCKISRGYNSEFGDLQYQNFSVTSRTATDELLYQESAVASGTLDPLDIYGLRIRRISSDVHFYYRTVTSGITSAWNYMSNKQMFDTDAKIVLSSYNNVGGTLINTFDDLTYTEGTIAYISTASQLPYYGSMVMDNVESDGFTVEPLAEMSVDRNNMYRLHGTSTYNYKLSPLESFVTSISLSASPAIIAANGLSTTDIKAWVKDQFLQPIQGRRVTFSENGDGDITGGTNINTDSDGYAQTEYTAGTIASEILVTATVQQTS